MRNFNLESCRDESKRVWPLNYSKIVRKGNYTINRPSTHAYFLFYEKQQTIFRSSAHKNLKINRTSFFGYILRLKIIIIFLDFAHNFR